MALSVTCTSAKISGGKAYIRFGSDELEFTSAADARAFIDGMMDKSEARQFLQAMLLAIFFARGGSASTISSLQGKTLTIDLQALENIVRLT